jgi:hypothetical protein
VSHFVVYSLHIRNEFLSHEGGPPCLGTPTQLQRGSHRWNWNPGWPPRPLRFRCPPSERFGLHKYNQPPTPPHANPTPSAASSPPTQQRLESNRIESNPPELAAASPPYPESIATAAPVPADPIRSVEDVVCLPLQVHHHRRHRSVALPPPPSPTRIRCFRGSDALAPLRLAPCSSRPEGEGGTGWDPHPPLGCHR